METKESDTMAQLLRQYGCGPMQFAGAAGLLDPLSQEEQDYAYRP